MILSTNSNVWGGIPIKVSSESDMANYASPMYEGCIIKYIGPTTQTYTQNTLYIVTYTE